MIDLVLRLKDIGWTVYFHVAVTCYHTDLIVSELRALGASEKYVAEAEGLIGNCVLDEGLTYVNRGSKEAVAVVELTTSPREFQNSLQHEIRHVIDRIAIIEGFYYEEETLGYLTGEVNGALFPYVQHLLCGSCATPRQRDEGRVTPHPYNPGSTFLYAL